MTAHHVYILYENEEWMVPLERELKAAGLEYTKWHMEHTFFDVNSTPPEGIFLNRMSPSSHTRGHTLSVDNTLNTIYWLESHGRRVINGSHAFLFEISKVRQYAELEKAGIKTPHTLAVPDNKALLKDAAKTMPLPFITKHNRGGKGLGVRLFNTLEDFESYLEAGFEPSIDNITLLQEYVKPREPFITRIEIVNGEFQYAIQASTEQGFELCPAESCEIGDQFCPTTDAPEEDSNRQDLFSLRTEFDHSIVDKYIAFLKAHQIDIAGIEFIENANGEIITYDINTTTNYSPGVEDKHGLNGMKAIAEFISNS